MCWQHKPFHITKDVLEVKIPITVLITRKVKNSYLDNYDQDEISYIPSYSLPLLQYWSSKGYDLIWITLKSSILHLTHQVLNRIKSKNMYSVFNKEFSFASFCLQRHATVRLSFYLAPGRIFSPANRILKQSANSLVRKLLRKNICHPALYCIVISAL